MTQDYDHEEYLEGDEIEIEAIGIDVDAHPIELYSFLKSQTWSVVVAKQNISSKKVMLR